MWLKKQMLVDNGEANKHAGFQTYLWKAFIHAASRVGHLRLSTNLSFLPR